MSRRHLLVGSGIAALSAAEEIRRIDPQAHTVLVSRESHPVYSRPGLAYLLTGEIPESRLFLRTPEDLRRMGLERVHGSMDALDYEGHRVRLADGRFLDYDRLLLATGAESILPSFEGADLEDVVRLDGIDDARHILRRASEARSAVVIGGGSTALELAEAFAARKLRTHYLLRGERYWSKVLDPAESRLVEGRLERDGVRVHRATQVTRAVASSSGRLAAVETSQGERIECDLLATALGVRPRTQVAREAGLLVDRGILVDECLTTSAPDVFAAGDVAQVRDPATGEAPLDTLWSSAEAQGRVAGRNMAGATERYRKAVAVNVTRLAGLTTTIIGEVGSGDDPDLITITRGQSERWRSDREAWALETGGSGSRLRLLVGRDRIVGALVMGDQTLSRPLMRLIQGEADVSVLRDVLQNRPEAVTQLILEFFRSWEATHSAA